MPDHRDASRIRHDLFEMVMARVSAIACGRKDAIDLDGLRQEPTYPINYSITSSAMARRPGGTSMPSALAVCRLITNANLVDCTTGSDVSRVRP
jgi:hypothetical protein